MANSRSGPKLKTLAEAARLVRPGDMLGVGGMTLYRKPMAFIREIVRVGTGNLTLLSFASSMEAELLALAGKLGTIRTCYMGLEFLGLAPALRRATETRRGQDRRRNRVHHRLRPAGGADPRAISALA